MIQYKPPAHIVILQPALGNPASADLDPPMENRREGIPEVICQTDNCELAALYGWDYTGPICCAAHCDVGMILMV